MKELVEEEEALKTFQGSLPPANALKQAKLDGFSDRYLAKLLALPEEEIRRARTAYGVVEGWEGVHVSGTKDCLLYTSRCV